MRALALLALALLIPTLPISAAQASTGDLYALADDAGDVALVGATDVRQAWPDQDSHSYIDVRGLQIKDLDEEYLEFRLSIADAFRMQQQTSGTWVSTTSLSHEIHFSVPGAAGQPTPMLIQTDNIQISVVNNQPSTDWQTTYATLCIPDPNFASGCFFYGRALETTIEDGALVLMVPKLLLTQTGYEGSYDSAGAAALPLRLFPGDALTSIKVVAYEEALTGGITITGAPTGDGARFEDTLPNTGTAPDFKLTYASPTNDLQMGFSQLGFVAGEEQVVPILITNSAPVKRIVNVTAEAFPIRGGDWSLSITPTVTLASGQSANLTLRIRPPAIGDEGAPIARLKLRGDVITQPGTVGISSIYAMAGYPLDAAHSKFFLHGYAFQTFTGLLPGLPDVGPGSFGFATVSRFETDPFYSAEAVPFNNYYGIGTGSASLRLQLDVFGTEMEPNAATYVPGKPIKATIAYDSPLPFDADLTVQILQGETALTATTVPVTFAQGKGTFSADLPVLPEIKRFDPNNGTLRMSLIVSRSGADGAAISAALFLGPHLYIEPQGTSFEFPLEREKAEAVVQPPLRASLAASEDLEAFVNPGKSTVFEFDLRNEEPKQVRLDVGVTNASAPWENSIRPGSRFRLEGNDSVHLAAVVSVPASAKEGDAFTALVLVKDADSGLPVTVARIRAIVTTGVEIEDESFAEATEDASKVDHPVEKSPAGNALLALVPLVAILALRRKRDA